MGTSFETNKVIDTWGLTLRMHLLFDSDLKLKPGHAFLYKKDDGVRLRYAMDQVVVMNGLCDVLQAHKNRLYDE